MDLGFLILGSIPGTEDESGAVLDLDTSLSSGGGAPCQMDLEVGAAGDVAPGPSGRQVIPGKGHHFTGHRGPTAPATWAPPCPALSCGYPRTATGPGSRPAGWQLCRRCTPARTRTHVPTPGIASHALPRVSGQRDL